MAGLVRAFRMLTLAGLGAALLILPFELASAKRNTAASKNPEATQAELERALAGFERSANPKLDNYVNVLGRLSHVYRDQRRDDDAERLLLRGLQLLESRLGSAAERHPFYPDLLGDLGSIYLGSARLPEAEAVLKRSLAARRAQEGDRAPGTAAAMYNLANLLNAESRYAEAEILYRDALVIFEKALPPNHPYVAKVLTNFANNYIDQGRTLDALGLQQRVLAMHEKSLGPAVPEIALLLVNIANSYVALGRNAEAAPLYERALAIYEQRFGPDSPQSAIAVASAGRLAQQEGRRDEAERYLTRALAIEEKASGPDRPLVADFLRSLALIDMAREDYPSARIKLERALSIGRTRLGDGHRRTLGTMYQMAGVASAQGQFDEAVEILRRASALAHGRPRSGILGADARLTDLDSALTDALWHAGRGKSEDAVMDEAFAAAQRAYETQAGQALAQMAVRFGAGDDAIAAVVRRQQDLTATLAGLDQRITSELGAADGTRNDALIGKLRAEAARAQTSLDETSVTIARDFPGYAELSNPAPLSIAQVQALLKPDEALVSYLGMKEQTYVFAMTRERRIWQEIPLKQAAIADRITLLRAGLFDPAPDAGPLKFNVDVAHELYAALLGPVEAVIATRPKLLIVPSGPLTSLPFQVLVSKKPDASGSASDRIRKAAWLVNDKAITMLPAVSSLRALRSFARASKATKPFIGYGDPVLQRSDGGTQRSAKRSVEPYQNYYNGAAVDTEALRRGLPALPDTADELRAVARALGAPDDAVRLGLSASVTAVTREGLEQYRVVDFATHGLVAGEVGGLSEPALVLSLPDTPTAEDNGLLTASRVAKLNLDADWAVLSACNTAAGDSPGAEGLSGLARAFFYAGARALLVSHWPVESDAAVRLTTGAFAELAKNPGIGRAEALRRSMRALIADRSSPRNAEPGVWAPFVLVGEGN